MTPRRPEQRLRAATRLAARLGGAMIFLIALLVCGDVITRNLFNMIVFHSYELANYLFAIAVALSFAFALVERAHIRIEVLYIRFPVWLRRGLDVLALAGVAGTAGLFAWKGWALALGNIARGSKSNSALGLAVGWPQAVWAAGLTVFALVALLLALRHIQLLVTRRARHADALGGIGSEMPLDDPVGPGTDREAAS